MSGDPKIANAMRSMVQTDMDLTSATLKLKSDAVQVRLSVASPMNIDNIITDHWKGRKIQIVAHEDNGDTITIRDNQSGSNIEVNSTSIALGAGDSVWFRAAKPGGVEHWYQDSDVANVS